MAQSDPSRRSSYIWEPGETAGLADYSPAYVIEINLGNIRGCLRLTGAFCQHTRLLCRTSGMSSMGCHKHERNPLYTKMDTTLSRYQAALLFDSRRNQLCLLGSVAATSLFSFGRVERTSVLQKGQIPLFSSSHLSTQAV